MLVRSTPQGLYSAIEGDVGRYTSRFPERRENPTEEGERTALPIIIGFEVEMKMVYRVEKPLSE